MKVAAIRMNRDSIEKAMSTLRWKMKLNRKAEILSLQFHSFSKRALKWSFKLLREQTPVRSKVGTF